MFIVDSNLERLVEQHRDLPLVEIRAALPVANYGFGNIFRNDVFKKSGKFYLSLLPNDSQQWDCYLGAQTTYDILLKKGITSRIVMGRDSQKIFRNHFWVELNDGRIIDPTPIYSLVEDDPAKKHSKSQEIEVNSFVNPVIPLDSLLPLRIKFGESNFRMSYLGVAKVRIPNNIGIEFGIKNIDLLESGMSESSTLVSEYLSINTLALVKDTERLSEMVYRNTGNFDLSYGHDYLLERGLIEAFIINVAKADRYLTSKKI